MAFGLFFDLDGTIVDSEPVHWLAWKGALRRFDVELSWDEYQNRCIGHSDREILARYAVIHGWTGRVRFLERLFQLKTRIFLDTARQRSLVPEPTVRLLHDLRGRKLSLVTSSTRAEALAVLAADSLDRCFSMLVCYEDVARTKPDPEPYRNAMRCLAVRDGIAFEDSDSGLASAQAAGLDVVRVQTPASLAETVMLKLTRLSSCRTSRRPRSEYRPALNRLAAMPVRDQNTVLEPSS